MSDEEYSVIKNQIIELGVMCVGINRTFSELKEQISELDKIFSKLQSDFRNIKSEANILEVF